MLAANLMAELFGGGARYRALRCLYEEPTRAFGTRELASVAGIDPGNASRWLRRWAEVGLVDRHLDRSGPVFQAANNPDLSPLALLLQQNSRIAEILQQQIAAQGDAVEAAAIYGSAARGEARADSDIDLLLITSIPQLKAQALMKPAGRVLGRPVNVLAYSAAEWRAAVRKKDVFVAEILSRPLVLLKGDLNGAAQA